MKEDLGKPNFELHGTIAGYRAHRRNQEEACDACKRANSEYMKRYRAGEIEPRDESRSERQRQALANADERTQAVAEKMSIIYI